MPPFCLSVRNSLQTTRQMSESPKGIKYEIGPNPKKSCGPVLLYPIISTDVSFGLGKENQFFFRFDGHGK